MTGKVERIPPARSKRSHSRVEGGRIKPAHPQPGKTLPNIERWKFDAVRRAILAAIPDGPEGLAFKDLPQAVEQRLTADERSRLGSVSWYTTSVKLAMEAMGEIERVPKASPQRLRRSTPNEEHASS